MTITPASSLEYWSSLGRTDIVRELLTTDIEVNLGDCNGYTALHGAAENGHAEIVRILLMHGADPTRKLVTGETAYDLACKSGHTVCAALINSASNPQSG